MGLLDGLIAAYQGGMGLLAPNDRDVEMRPQIAKGLLGILPGSGDAISGYDAVQSARQGKYGEAALNGVGLLPFIPAMGGMVKGAIHSPEEALAIAKQLNSDVKRVVNPKTWDDSLGGAAWFDKRTPGYYHAIHVTDNPSKAGKRIKNREDVTATYRDGRNLGELGSGLYVSARPEMWASRASEGVRHDIPVSVSGDFVEIERPWAQNLDKIRELGFDGAYMRGAMGAVPQMVIWNTDAIQSFGKYTK